MANSVTTRPRLSADMGKTLVQFRTHMRELGLSLSIWDEQGQMAGKFQPCNAFCQSFFEAGAPCVEECGALARQVGQSGKPVTRVRGAGCCLVGVPLQQRRRMLGSVVACYPPRSMSAEEDFVRWCDRFKVDFKAAFNMAAGLCRHEARQADDFLHILGWMLEREQAVQTAQDELANLSANLASTYEELGLLYAISGSMDIHRQPKEFLQNVCSQVLEVMDLSASAGVIYARSTAEEEIVVAGDVPLDASRIKLLANRHVGNGRPANQPVLENDFPVSDGIDGIRNFIAVPLASNDQPIGILMGFNKRRGDFDSTDLKLIGSLGSQAAIFLDCSRLYADLKDLLMGVLHAMTASIDAKDPYTCGHSQRVAMISLRLAEACGVSAERAQRIYLAGLLHDIGKIGVLEAILRKPGRLTVEEYEAVKGHPTIGARILGGIHQLDDVVIGIFTHHERPDGKGYPRGLKGEEIPLEGRILGLADCFDAMTSDRTYRKALSLETAMEEIERNAGTQIDAMLVGKFLAMDLKAFMSELTVRQQNPLAEANSGSGNECK